VANKAVDNQIACGDFGVTDLSLTQDFVAGYIAELTGQDWTDYIPTCFTQS
jgi:hypothetical protein